MADFYRFIIVAKKQTMKESADETVSLRRKKIKQLFDFEFFTAKKSLFTAVKDQSISLKNIRVKGQSQSVSERKQQLADLTAVISFFIVVK